MSFIRDYYELSTYLLRNLDYNTIQVGQLCFIERPMCVYWDVYILDHPVRDIVFPYTAGSAPCSFLWIAHAWPLLARRGYDQARILLQLLILSSCDLKSGTGYVLWVGLFFSLGGWSKPLI